MGLGDAIVGKAAWSYLGDTLSIDRIPANRRLVEELHAHGCLTAAARQAALEFLNPHDQWGLWISRLLLVLGSALVLSGVVYFFAYNWNLIPPTVKFAAIQTGVVVAVAVDAGFGCARHARFPGPTVDTAGYSRTQGSPAREPPGIAGRPLR